MKYRLNIVYDGSEVLTVHDDREKAKALCKACEDQPNVAIAVVTDEEGRCHFVYVRHPKGPSEIVGKRK